MTKELQDAIRHIKTRCDADMVKVIIDALEQQPITTSTDEPMVINYPFTFCDDAISRETTTAEFIKWQNEVVYAFGRDYLGVRIIQSAIDTIRELPSVQPSRKVIEDIKADIESARYGLINDGLDVALRIIDKHISRKE